MSGRASTGEHTTTDGTGDLRGSGVADGGVTSQSEPLHRTPSARVARTIDMLCTAIMCIVLIGNCAIICTSVAMRSLHLGSLIWGDSATEVGLAFLAFLGAVSAFLRNEHVGLTGLQGRFGPRVSAEIRGGIALISLAFAAIIAFYGVQFALQPELGEFPATGWPTSVLYIPFAAGSVMLSVVAIARLVEGGVRGFPWIAAGILIVLGAVVWFISKDGGLNDPNAQTIALVVAVLALAVMVLIGTPIAMAIGLATVVGVQLSGLPMTQIPLQMTGHVINISLIALPLFVLVGVLYGDQRIAERLTAVIERVSRRIPGSEGLAAIGSMFVFSGLSGSKLADVAAVAPAFVGRDDRRGPGAMSGLDPVPLERRAETSGILSASAVMGETIPPSIVMVVLGSVTTISTAALFVAGLVPALLVGLCIAIAVVIWRVRRGNQTPVAVLEGVAQEPMWRLLAKALPALLGIVIIAGGIVLGIATPSEASAIAAVYSLLLVVVLFRPSPRLIIQSLAKTARLSGMLLFMVAAAGALTWFLSATGIGQYIGELSAALHGNRPLFLILFVIILVVLGSALEGIPAIIMLGPILIPQATALGVDPLQAGILFLLALGMGVFLPPLGNGFYTACVVCRVTPKEALGPTLRYMAAVTVGVLIVAFVPIVSVGLPGLFHM